MSFPCTGCGECCRRIAPPEFRLANGICRYLDGSRCSVYDVRPRVCRVDDMRPNGMPEGEYYTFMAGMCNAAQQLANIPDTFRVRLIERI